MVFESLCPFCEGRASFTALTRSGRLSYSWSIRCQGCGGQLPTLSEPDLRRLRATAHGKRRELSSVLRRIERPLVLSLEALLFLGDRAPKENARRAANRARRDRLPRMTFRRG